MPELVLDVATFNELQDNAGAEFVAELAGTFFEEAPRMLQEMRRAQLEGDTEAFRRAAHSLKSNGQTFGALRLSHRARELELGGVPADSTPIEALQAEYDGARRALLEILGG
jgi:HPt (histidine-containing phosphotransfer) domain-containing protein